MMVSVSARKRLEIIERDVIPSMFVGVLSKDDEWLKHTLEETLPELEVRSLHLARECRKAENAKRMIPCAMKKGFRKCSKMP